MQAKRIRISDIGGSKRISYSNMTIQGGNNGDMAIK